MKITSRLLKSKGACNDQVALFIKLGGDELELTEDLCLKYADQFCWDWGAQHLLSPSALAEFERVEDLAWAQYQRVRIPAWAEYERANILPISNPQRADILLALMAEYERVEASARAQYQRIQASAFFNAWRNE